MHRRSPDPPAGRAAVIRHAAATRRVASVRGPAAGSASRAAPDPYRGRPGRRQDDARPAPGRPSPACRSTTSTTSPGWGAAPAASVTPRSANRFCRADPRRRRAGSPRASTSAGPSRCWRSAELIVWLDAVDGSAAAGAHRGPLPRRRPGRSSAGAAGASGSPAFRATHATPATSPAPCATRAATAGPRRPARTARCRRPWTPRARSTHAPPRKPRLPRTRTAWCAAGRSPRWTPLVARIGRRAATACRRWRRASAGSRAMLCPASCAPRSATSGRRIYLNAYALIVSNLLTSALGIVYWGLAARLYPCRIVGLSAALTSLLLFVSGVTQLNLRVVLIRLVPEAGGGTRRLVGRAYAHRARARRARLARASTASRSRSGSPWTALAGRGHRRRAACSWPSARWPVAVQPPGRRHRRAAAHGLGARRERQRTRWPRSCCWWRSRACCRHWASWSPRPLPVHGRRGGGDGVLFRALDPAPCRGRRWPHDRDGPTHVLGFIAAEFGRGPVRARVDHAGPRARGRHRGRGAGRRTSRWPGRSSSRSTCSP